MILDTKVQRILKSFNTDRKSPGEGPASSFSFCFDIKEFLLVMLPALVPSGAFIQILIFH